MLCHAKNVINVFDEESDKASCAVIYMDRLWETFFDEKEIQQTSWAVTLECEKRFFDGKWWSIMCCAMHRMWKTFFDEKDIQQTSWSVPWTRSAVNARNVFWREVNS